MTAEDLEFPILLAGFEGDIDVIPDAKRLHTPTRVALKKNFYQKAAIVDRTGKRYQVTSVEVLGGVGPFFGWNIFGNRRLSVRLAIEPVEQLDIAQVRALALSAMERNAELWEATDTNIKHQISDAQNLEEVFGLFESVLGPREYGR